MFDNIKFDSSIRLPVSKEFRKLKIDPHSLEFQTKSLENTLSLYEVRKNKRIYKDNKKINYHGIINFGACHITDTVTYNLDYEAKFTDGFFKSLKLIKHEVWNHESRKLQHEKLLKNVKKRNNKLSLRILRFLEKNLILYPLNILGLDLKQVGLGTLSSSSKNIIINFYCPKIVLGYKKEHKNNKSYGLSLDCISTELLYEKTQYSSSFSCKLLGFGFSVFNHLNFWDVYS